MNLKFQQACLTLKAGKLLVYPTESVFGIGCLAKNRNAVKKLRQVKRRQETKGFIVLCSSIEQMLENFPEISITTQQLKLIKEKHAHPTTWLIPCKRSQLKLLTGNNRRIAIRITEHAIAKQLCDSCGPIVSSSANPAKVKTPETLLKIRKHFQSQVDFYFNEKLGGKTKTSQIIDIVNGEIIRGA